MSTAPSLGPAIHPLALVDPAARLHPGVRVGPFAVVEADVELGPNVSVASHAVVRRFTQVGAGTQIHSGAVLGGEPQDLTFTGAQSALVVGERCVIREGVTLHRASRPGAATSIGDDCFLMAYAHVAHDCRLGARVILANNVALAGHVRIEDRAFLSGGVVVHQFCRVGRLAMVGGNTKVVQDCLPFVVTDGHPGHARGLNAVGLKRAGYGAADLRRLREAYRLLLRSTLPLAAALEALAGLRHPLVDELAGFAAGAKRGFHRPRREPARGGEAEALDRE